MWYPIALRRYNANYLGSMIRYDLNIHSPCHIVDGAQGCSVVERTWCNLQMDMQIGRMGLFNLCFRDVLQEFSLLASHLFFPRLAKRL